MTKIALLIPCYNEEQTIGLVINDFKKYLPEVEIYVCDNNSSDRTSQIALEHGANVLHEYRQGKANAVRFMFQKIEADYYIMVDGDNTYPASYVNKLLETMSLNHCEMVVGDRLTNGTYSNENKRAFHNFGNNLVRWLINIIFKSQLNDIMTGYRIFSKRFVKNYPIMCQGFELETEMTIFALSNHLNIAEVPIVFSERPMGSYSKLNTFSDGKKVILTIFNLFRHYKPLQFFSTIALLFILSSFAVGIPVIIEYFKFHFVYKVPSAILASSLMLFALMSLTIGLILDTISINEKRHLQIELQKWS